MQGQIGALSLQLHALGNDRARLAADLEAMTRFGRLLYGKKSPLLEGDHEFLNRFS